MSLARLRAPLDSPVVAGLVAALHVITAFSPAGEPLMRGSPLVPGRSEARA